MNDHTIVIVTARLLPGTDKEFTTWKAHHDRVIGNFPGYVGGDMIAPPAGSREWTIMLNFSTSADAETWRSSKERLQILAEGQKLLEGGVFGEVVETEDKAPERNVTEVIFSKIKTGQEDAYREWAARMQAAQAAYPGYQGMFLQPPDEKGGMWTTILRFDTAPHLEAWMAAPERKEMLKESKAFIEHEQLTRLATAFPGWVPIDPTTGKGPPNWKAAMLVLLGLFPIVMLEMKFLSPILGALGLHASLATFIGNTISVGLTSFLTMPLFVRWFGWWLFPKESSATAKGVGILVVLFALEVIVLWRLLPW